jgi:RNA polymerase sigma-70 factor (ECF subfamily)
MKYNERLPREISFAERHDDGAGPIVMQHSITPALLAEKRERLEKVRAAVLGLPVEFRETVVLCDLEELTYEQAAQILDCPIGTIRSRLHRGRALLLAKLEMFRDAPQRWRSAR